jgi:hypothetical protein
MRYGVCALAMMAVTAFAAPASAHVVQATTSVSLTDVDLHDTPQLESALRSAVADVLADTIAFTPTLVALTDARVIDDRLYLRLLIADDDGMRTLEALDESAREGAESTRVPALPANPTGRTEL